MRRWLRRGLAAAAVVVLMACHRPPSPAPPPVPVPVPVQSSPEANGEPIFSLLESPFTSGGVDAAAPIQPEPHEVSFEPVQLPAGTPSILAIDGRGPTDMWMLTSQSEVLQWNGHRVKSHGRLQCFADSCCGRLVNCRATPAACGPTCSLPPMQCARPVAFSALEVRGTEVVAVAVIDTGGLRPSLIEARASTRFRCEQPQGDLVYPGTGIRGQKADADELTLDGHVVRLEGPAWLVNPLGGTSLVIDGRRVLVPPGAERGTYLAADRADDLWLWTPSGDVWRGNGLRWQGVAIDFDQLAELWMAGGAVWALAAHGDASSATLLRWDELASSWTATAAPGADEVHRSETGFWLLGAGGLYVYEGDVLRKVTSPLNYHAGWLDDGGELWIAGEMNGRGAVFRLPPQGVAK
ncbi:MAG: hypothetical protein AAF715_17360 [Myxococcota bacterium]